MTVRRSWRPPNSRSHWSRTICGPCARQASCAVSATGRSSATPWSTPPSWSVWMPGGTWWARCAVRRSSSTASWICRAGCRYEAEVESKRDVSVVAVPGAHREGDGSDATCMGPSVLSWPRLHPQLRAWSAVAGDGLAAGTVRRMAGVVGRRNRGLCPGEGNREGRRRGRAVQDLAAGRADAVAAPATDRPGGIAGIHGPQRGLSRATESAEGHTPGFRATRA